MAVTVPSKRKVIAMMSTQPRHDDIIIRRRFGEHAATHSVKQLYVIICQGQIDVSGEHEIYDNAEASAIALAQGHGRSVWYEENPQSGRRTLVKTFRAEP